VKYNKRHRRKVVGASVFNRTVSILRMDGYGRLMETTNHKVSLWSRRRLLRILAEYYSVTGDLDLRRRNK
jgi:hypothetical protein